MPVRKVYFLVSLLVILLVIIPYLFAFQLSINDMVFGGFLINIIDGNSYLAKMQQGYRGEWKFTLPYTAEAGDGAYLFLLYIGLGHLARILNLSLIFTYHLARIISAGFTLWILGLFVSAFFQTSDNKKLAFCLSVLGSGLGWIGVMLGLFTSDFWVAEAYPFLSMYTNPHFTLGLGLMMLGLLNNDRHLIFEIMLGVGLGLIQPFGVVIVLFTKLILVIVNLDPKPQDWFYDKHLQRKLLELLSFSLAGGSILIYQYWSIITDPVLNIWNQQNITPSPGLADFLLAFSPGIFLAGIGLKSAWKSKTGKTLVCWAVISVLLILFPWNLQRRFMTGLYIPLSLLSVYGVNFLIQRKQMSKRFVVAVLFLMVLPTNMIVLASGINAAYQRDDKVYYQRAVIDGLQWIKQNSEPDALIVSNSDLGSLIPSRTGRKVIYGHPFETINSDAENEFIEDFFSGGLTGKELLQEINTRNAHYILVTAEEEDLQNQLEKLDFPTLYSNDFLKIYGTDYG